MMERGAICYTEDNIVGVKVSCWREVVRIVKPYILSS